ncbi:MAG: hypothetical protein R3D30_13170 [Hyphomicrobiales bacterium]
MFSKVLVGQDADVSANDQAARLSQVRRYLDGYMAGHWDEARPRLASARSGLGLSGTISFANRLFLGEFGAMQANG